MGVSTRILMSTQKPSNTINCALCGELHEVKYAYKDIPILACPKAEEGKIYTFREDFLAKFYKTDFLGAFYAEMPLSKGEREARSRQKDSFIRTVPSDLAKFNKEDK